MPVTESFLAFVLEQLDAVGPMTAKRMFGGVGLYAGDLFFALLANDVLYLKAGDANRAQLEAAGARPFRPYPDRDGTMQYYDVPVAILEDGDELTRWAKTSVAVARAERADPRPRRQPVTRVTPSRSRTRSKPASSSGKPAGRRNSRRH
jgi:DNA transformation protein